MNWNRICSKRCIIGEGPIWNKWEEKLYFTNGYGNEICRLDIETGALSVRPVEEGAAAFAFDRTGRLIVSRADGVLYLNEDGTAEHLYDPEKYTIRFGNDMKAGPDGAIYVGTLSQRKKGLADLADGKLYRISPAGEVTVLLEGLDCANGMDWSMDETRFYFTDSSTNLIREFDFRKASGTIAPTGRVLQVPGVDGFAMDREDRILATGWGFGCLYVIDTKTFTVAETHPLPVASPASCGFAGRNMEYLAVVTASFHADLEAWPESGSTYLCRPSVPGREPYLYGR